MNMEEKFSSVIRQETLDRVIDSDYFYEVMDEIDIEEKYDIFKKVAEEYIEKRNVKDIKKWLLKRAKKGNECFIGKYLIEKGLVAKEIEKAVSYMEYVVIQEANEVFEG